MCMYLCCSIGSAFCNCLCLPAQALGVAKRNYSKLAYVFVHMLWLLITLIAVYCTQGVNGWMARIVGRDCTEENAPMYCYGSSSFVRLSFTLLVFHLLILLTTMARTEMTAKFNDGCWCFKLLFIFGFFVISFWIPNDPFFTSFYLQMSCVLSLAFLGF